MSGNVMGMIGGRKMFQPGSLTMEKDTRRDRWNLKRYPTGSLGYEKYTRPYRSKSKFLLTNFCKKMLKTPVIIGIFAIKPYIHQNMPILKF